MIIFYLLCGLAAIPTSFLAFSPVFTNATPEHWCAPPPELESLGLPEDFLRSLTVPGTHESYESCREYAVDPNALYEALDEYIVERFESIRKDGALRKVKIQQLTTMNGTAEKEKQMSRVKEAVLSIRSTELTACTVWRFNKEHYKRTLVTDFSLVCDNEWLPRTSNTLFWVGSIFGNLFFGLISDRYGRRPTILLMILLEVPLAIAASFITSYWSFIVLRVAGGLFFPAMYQLPFILALELMPPGRRNSAGIVVGMLFAAGMCLLSMLAYVLRDWFHLSLVTTMPFILLYGYYWLIPESPRWLVGRGRIADAEKVFRNLASRNGISLPRGFLLELHKKVKEEDADAEIRLLANINGHVTGLPAKDEYLDRRISNLFTFKPDITNLTEIEVNKADSLERNIALEVADIVNKNTNIQDIFKDDQKTADSEESNHTNTDFHQNSTQTDFKSPGNTIRRKSLQIVNKIFIQDDEEDDVEKKRMDDQNSEGDCKASPLDLFRYPNIRRKFFILTFDWIALGIAYNGLSYNTPNYGVDDYLAFFIGGVVELPSYFIAWRCIEHFGRRWVLFTFMCTGGLACLSCVLIPESWPWVTVCLAMFGRLCSASSFAVFYVVIGELLPTVIRAQAMGIAFFIAGLCFLACPYIVHLAIYLRTLPLIVMGILIVMGGIASLFLPETLNQPLPQTLGDGEMFCRDFKILSCVERPNKKRSRIGSASLVP